MSSDDFHNPGEALRGFLERHGAASAGASALAFWAKAVGPVISKSARARALKNGCLQVGVNEPAWIAELDLQKTKLVERFQAEVPRAGVKEIRFYLERPRPEQAYTDFKPPPSFSLEGIPAPDVAPLPPMLDEGLHASLSRLRITLLRVEAWKQAHPGEDPWAVPELPIVSAPSDSAFFFPGSGVVSEFLDPGEA